MKPIDFEAQFFVPGKGIPLFISSDRLMGLSFLVFMSSWFIKSEVEYLGLLQKQTLDIFMLLSVLSAIYSSLWGLKAEEKKHGHFEGILKITDSHIQADGRTFSWVNIKSLNFRIGLVKGEPRYEFGSFFYRYRFYGSPNYSAGLDNYIEFEYLEQKIKLRFELDSYRQQSRFKNTIKELFYREHISLYETYTGLKLEYEEIQKLKDQKNTRVKPQT